MNQTISMFQVNTFSREEFTRVFGSVFEHSSWIAAMAWKQRPFESLDALHSSLCETVRNASEEKHLELIRAHPDLVGRAALAGTLTPASTAEQASAGLNRLTREEIATFQKHNQAYSKKFDFPFVICARLNKKEAILRAFPVRLEHSRETEIQTALEEIYKIAYLRLKDIITGHGGEAEHSRP